MTKRPAPLQARFQGLLDFVSEESKEMEFYPAELATPPLALVALLGLPDLHSKIGNYLRSNHRPPINSISIPETSGAGRVFGENIQQDHAPNISMVKHDQQLIGHSIMINIWV